MCQARRGDFAVEHVRGSVVADGPAGLQIRWAMVPIVFCQTRKLARSPSFERVSRPRRDQCCHLGVSSTVSLRPSGAASTVLVDVLLAMWPNVNL